MLAVGGMPQCLPLGGLFTCYLVACPHTIMAGSLWREWSEDKETDDTFYELASEVQGIISANSMVEKSRIQSLEERRVKEFINI